MLRLASLLDAMGFEYSGAGIRGVRESVKMPAQFTFIFSACRADGLSAFDVLRAAKNGEEIPQGSTPIDDDILQSRIDDAHRNLIAAMQQCQASGNHIFIKITSDRGTAFIPQNASKEERNKYAELL